LLIVLSAFALKIIKMKRELMLMKNIFLSLILIISW
jgi:hypothetical protein